MPERLLIEARNGTVAVEDGLIAEPHGHYDTVLRFPHSDVRPGLINAHEHLHRNHYGRFGHPPYESARAWGRDVESRHREAIARGRRWPCRAALMAGAWKNLFAGATTAVHHDPWEPDFDRGFPLRVARIACADSAEDETPLAALRAGEPFCLHLAEGIGSDAADEVRILHGRGLLNRNLIAVHGIGMDRDGCGLFRKSGAALAWCPSSNVFLFGRTAPAELFEDGIDILLGSDSLLSGAGNLLDELRAARRLGLLSDRRLEDAVGCTAARRLGLAEPSLEPGRRADLVVLSKPLLEASAHEVELVVVAGVPRIAAKSIASRLQDAGFSFKAMTCGGVARWVNDSGPESAEAMNRKGFRAALQQTGFG